MGKTRKENILSISFLVPEGYKGLTMSESFDKN